MTETKLRADETIVCRNATVIADKNGNLSWIDNEKAEISLSAKEDEDEDQSDR